MTRQPEPKFSLGKSIVFSVVLFSTVLGLMELAVRGWAYWLRDDVEKWDLETQTFVLTPGEYRSSRGRATINSQGFAGSELKADGQDLWRIVAVGDSCTYGGGSRTRSYPAMLQALLEERETRGRRYEVVNTGISGLSSELALRRLRTKVLPLGPEVILIYVGWNDLMKFDPAGQEGGERWRVVAGFLDRLWLVKGMRKLVFYYVRPHLRSPATGPESRTGRFDRFRPIQYEENLRAMISSVREIEALPVLTTLPTVVRLEMTADDLRRAGVVFPYFVSSYGVGDFLDLIGAYNDAVRRVGREERVPVVDLARTFDALSDPTPYFWDTMHTNLEGRMLTARTLLRGLELEGLLGAAATSR